MLFPYDKQKNNRIYSFLEGSDSIKIKNQELFSLKPIYL